MSFVKEFRVERRNKLTEEGKKRASEKITKMRKEDEKLVKGIFKNKEAPGAHAIFSVRFYKEHPIQTYTLKDGETYDLPLGVAKHINRQCQYRKSTHLIDPKTGKQIVGAGKPLQRYEFVSTDYM